MIPSTVSRTFLLAAILVLAGGCAMPEEPRITGQRLYTEHNYADAAAALRQAVKDDPRDFRAYCYLGSTYQQMGAYHEAIEAFRAGLDVIVVTELGREDKEFRLRMMDGLAGSIARSEACDAEVDLMEKQARTDQTPQSFLILAKIARYRGDAEAAIDWYNRAVLLNSGDFGVLKEEGLYLVQLGQIDRAEAPLRKAYVLNSNDSDVNSALRSIGIVPGPSLMDRGDLARPVVPQGPIPELDMDKVKRGLGVSQTGQQPEAQPAAAPLPAGSGEPEPRD